MTWWRVMKDVSAYGVESRKPWLIVLVAILIALSCFLAVSEASLIAPYLYPLF